MNCELHGQCRLIGPRRRHGVEGIGYEHDPAQDRDGVGAEAEWITPAVETLMVIENGLGDLGVEPVPGHGEAQFGVSLHEIALCLTEWAGLAEDPRIEVDLPDIVEHTGQCEAIEIVPAQPYAASEVNREIGDAVNVPV